MKRSPAVYFLFFLSGITALVYEIIWTRMLTLVFGHTVFSVSVVLAAFMAGLGFGCYLFGNIIDAVGKDQLNPELRVSPVFSLFAYGSIEILIFAGGAILSLIFSHFSAFYSGLHTLMPDSSPALLNTVKAILAFVLMFVPTSLMGATLPIISKYYVTDDKELGSQVGLLYFINTLGAAAGCLFTGFVFINAFGVLQTALYASLVNLVVGVGAIRIYQDATGESSWFWLPKLRFPPLNISSGNRLWLGASFVCGFTALAYEVLWTRILMFSMSSSVYALSMMLAMFLLGIALGSLLAAPFMRYVSNLRTLLIAIQAGTGLYLIFSLYAMESLLSAPWNGYNLRVPAETFVRYFKDSAALMLVPTMFFGMAFPILIKLASGSSDYVGRGTGQIYVCNTFGAIAGSLVAGFVLLPKLGSEKSFIIVAIFNFLLALALFRGGNYMTLSTRKGLTTVMACVLFYVTTALPGNLLDSFFMRDSSGKRDPKKLLYFDEGVMDTVAIFTDDYGVLDPAAKRLVTNGVSMSASNEIASRYMKMIAHIPILLSSNPEDVLVICFGTGQTAGAAGIHPRVKSVDSVELSPGVVRGGTVFARENNDVLLNPKVRAILQDGRNHLLTTSKRYDVITAEPPPPHAAFAVNLYTREYYEQARSRLKPGGIVAQWVPLHSQSENEVAMHFRTFRLVFPYVLAWLPVANEVILIGSDRPFDLDYQKIKERLAEPLAPDIPDVYAFLGNLWFFEEQLDRLGAGKTIIS
ncbi:MAG: spermidine synthase, partial [Nitrospinae bacterium RIFCSPLOWO2_12_FULL_47_7]